MVTASFLFALDVGVKATFAQLLITVVVNLAISALLGKILAPKASRSGRDTKGIQNIIRSNIMPRRIIYGEAVVGGPYAMIESEGTTNAKLKMIVVVAAHPVEDIVGVYIDDQYVNIAGKTGGTTNTDSNDLSTSYILDTGKFGTEDAAGLVTIIKNNGWGFADFQYVTDGGGTDPTNDRARGILIDGDMTTSWTQPSDTRDSGTGLYTGTGYKLTNCAYIYLSFTYNRDVWSGFPKIKFHVKGKKLYNPQQDPTNFAAEGADSAGTHDINDPDTYTWSEDWTLSILDYLLNTSYGLGAKITGSLVEVNWEEMIQSYVDSSALITNALPSPDTEDTPRYTTNGVLETNSTPISNIESLLTSGGGELIYAQGAYKLRPAIYRLPNSSNDIINEDMIDSALSIQTHAPRADIFNKAAGVFVDKGYDENAALSDTNKPKFEPSDFGIVDPLDSSNLNPYEVIDDEEIIREFDFPFTTREFEAQRLARIQLERIRRGMTINFEANLKVLKYSVGDVVYLEILSDSKYANESFFNRLGLDDTVQNRPDSPFNAYYKQFKILDMQYTSTGTIQVAMIEEAEEIYEWNAGYASPTPKALESDIIADDPTGTVLAPDWLVASPELPITEVIATESGTTVTTLVRWNAAVRGSLVNAVDQVYIAHYRLEYGEVTDPSLVEGNRVATWLPTANKLSDHTQILQGPIALETLYKDGVNYDFRIRAVTYGGRQSSWAYYSTEVGSDYDPTAAPASTNNFYYIRPLDGNVIRNGSGALGVEAHLINGSVDLLLSSGSIQLYVGSTLIETASPGNYPSPSDGYTGTFTSAEIDGDVTVELKDGPSGTPLDTITLVDVDDGIFKDVKFMRSATVPATPTGDNPSGWTDDIPAGTNAIYQTTGKKTAGGTLIGVWSTPIRIQGITYRGTYESGTAYLIDDVVIFEERTYICVGATTGNAPSGSNAGNTWWDLLAGKGDTGSTPVSFTETIAITGTDPVNLRALADAFTPAYDGVGDATVTYTLADSVTITGNPGGGHGINTGTWPSTATISLTLEIDGTVRGGGGTGGAGGNSGFANGNPGLDGGDAIYCQEDMTVTNSSSGLLEASGAGSGGGGGASYPSLEPIDRGGGGGGGGYPNGTGGAGGTPGGGFDGTAGSAGTTGGGGAGGAGAGDAGDGATGGNVNVSGAVGDTATSSGFNGSGGIGGIRGYAVRKNGNTVTVTGGTVTGTQG